MLYMSAPRNERDFRVRKRRTYEYTPVRFFEHMGDNEPLPVFAEYLLPAKAVHGYAALRLARLNKQMNLRIVAQRLKVTHSLHRSGNGLLVNYAAVVELYMNAEAFLRKALKHLRLNFTHQVNIDFPRGISADQKLRILLLELTQLRQKLHRADFRRQKHTIGQNRLQHRLKEVIFKAESLPRICCRKSQNSTHAARSHFVRRLELFSGIYTKHIRLFFKARFTAFRQIAYYAACPKAAAGDFHIGKAVALRVASDFEHSRAEFAAVILLQSVFFKPTDKFRHAIEFQRRAEPTGENFAFFYNFRDFRGGNFTMLKVLFHQFFIAERRVFRKLLLRSGKIHAVF